MLVGNGIHHAEKAWVWRVYLEGFGMVWQERERESKEKKRKEGEGERQRAASSEELQEERERKRPRQICLTGQREIECGRSLCLKETGYWQGKAVKS